MNVASRSPPGLEVRSASRAPPRLAQSLRETFVARTFRVTMRYVALTKPRVMSLAVFTAYVGIVSAGMPLRMGSVVSMLICIAGGAGSAAALNMWYESDIDRRMTRTAMRPIPAGQISRSNALGFGLSLGLVAVITLGLIANTVAAVLLAGTIAFYVIVYTVWLKRRTSLNIVIGGAAGALPPVVGWAAAGGPVSLQPAILFLVILLWTPPHFWSLAVLRREEYARAGVPMLPVIYGIAHTKNQILVYSVLLVLTTLLPWASGFADARYGVLAAILGAKFLMLARRLWRSTTLESAAAHDLFKYSIFYLGVLFAGLLLEAAA